MAEQSVSNNGIKLGVGDFQAVRVSDAEFYGFLKTILVREQSCGGNEMLAFVDPRDPTRKLWPSSDRASSDAGTAAQIQDRSRRVNFHSIQILPHHLGKPRILVTRLESRHHDVQGCIIEFASDSVDINCFHGLHPVV